jgi:type I restriction enzyme R subunit
MPKLGTEKSAVQDTLIKYACEIGWEYINPEEALRLRRGNTGLIFKEVLTNQLIKLNSDFIDSIMIDDLIKQIGRLHPNIEGNLEAWEYLKGLKTAFQYEEKRERNIRFIDEKTENNIFHVTDEFYYTNGTNHNRYDVVFLINGIPILFVETKSVAKFIDRSVNRESIIAEALDQIRRYHRETPEAMTLFQVYTTTNIINFLYAATWSLEAKSVFNWRIESKEESYENLVKSFLNRERITEMLLNFILFTRQDDELKKVILRPHQMRAVNKLEERAASRKKRALIWHTQGSGKTYTMIVTAQRILESPVFQNPTVIMIVDRNELETQLFGNLSSVGLEYVGVAASKKHLKELLKNDTRGLIVSLIHKFEGMPQNINIRNNIFVLVDEAHRTTSGDLGNYLMGALPNATYFGFTGTPIDKTAHGKGTFKVFGIDDPPKGYLDKYGISESITDGTTVKLHYALAPNELMPDKEVLEREFLNLAESQGISDIETLNKVLEKAVTLKNMLKNKERVGKVTAFVVDHFKEYIEPMGFKAFLVAVDREACAIYKRELDKHLPKEYSEVIYSPFYNDSLELRRYHISEEQEKRIRKAFRNPNELPKILIVTEKLLTGFDAPILYCMYLDKPMRDHVLLQAIARVNRPYEDSEGRKKTSGFVLDFVGVFDKLEKALSFDSGDITGVVRDIEILKEGFSELIERAKKEYLILIKDKTRDKAVEAVLEHFRDETIRQGFYEFFKELSDIYEILSPDVFLRPYIDNYDTLARMFKILKEAYEPEMLIDKEFTRKTAKLVQEYTYSSEIKSVIDIYEINEETLKKIEESKSSDIEKIFNLLRSIGIIVDKESKTSPYLISIGEKAEVISLLFIQRQKDTQETLEELRELIKEINEAKKEQATKYMSADVFSAYWILREAEVPYGEGKAKSMQKIFDQYPYWKTNEEYERRFKLEVIKIFTDSNIEPKKAVTLTNKLVRILKGVKNDYSPGF